MKLSGPRPHKTQRGGCSRLDCVRHAPRPAAHPTPRHRQITRNTAPHRQTGIVIECPQAHGAVTLDHTTTGDQQMHGPWRSQTRTRSCAVTTGRFACVTGRPPLPLFCRASRAVARAGCKQALAAFAQRRHARDLHGSERTHAKASAFRSWIVRARVTRCRPWRGDLREL